MSWFSFIRKKKKKSPTIYTEESCIQCGQKLKRIFEDGDYVYKDGELCKKCSNKTLITAIYGEYPDEREHRQNYIC